MPLTLDDLKQRDMTATALRKDSDMEPKTLKALKASIAKWERNVEAEDPRVVTMGWAECPLCLIFNNRNGDRLGCEGCPVYAAVGIPYCGATPYDEAERGLGRWRYNGDEYRDQFASAAQAEVDFLKSLLPVEA